ncbi:hypothetical protein [Desulfosporosinus sp. FKB]|uniref:hypothetical protein n=1 Tax=Desulfosporosinus sp. FKB TaxID=1969835 RepID=UPI000B4A0FB5|nr:hypothetical protein [Desulfosporosinus sp. FKB]
MLFNRKNARITLKLIDVNSRLTLSLADSSLSTEEYKKLLGQKIVTIKWMVEQQINCLENAEKDRQYVINYLKGDPKELQFLNTIEVTSRQAHWVIANLGYELEPLLLAYGGVADRKEFAQLINAGVVETMWKTQACDSFDKDTTYEEWKYIMEHLFLNWMIDNQYRPFKSNPLSYALWKSKIQNNPETEFTLDPDYIKRRVATDTDFLKEINMMINGTDTDSESKSNVMGGSDLF